jgi:hypothetical protein
LPTALEAEPGIGLLLPCNVVLEALPEGGSRVRLMDAAAALGLVGNADLAPIAAEATDRLRRVAARLDPQARVACPCSGGLDGPPQPGPGGRHCGR